MGGGGENGRGMTGRAFVWQRIGPCVYQGDAHRKEEVRSCPCCRGPGQGRIMVGPPCAWCVVVVVMWRSEANVRGRWPPSHSPRTGRQTQGHEKGKRGIKKDIWGRWASRTHVVGEVGDGGDVRVDVEGAFLQVVVLVEVQPWHRDGRGGVWGCTWWCWGSRVWREGWCWWWVE